MGKAGIPFGILIAKEYSTGICKHRLSTIPFLTLYPENAKIPVESAGIIT
jgi:hypothetical protein